MRCSSGQFIVSESSANVKYYHFSICILPASSLPPWSNSLLFSTRGWPTCDRTHAPDPNEVAAAKTYSNVKIPQRKACQYKRQAGKARLGGHIWPFILVIFLVWKFFKIYHTPVYAMFVGRALISITLTVRPARAAREAHFLSGRLSGIKLSATSHCSRLVAVRNRAHKWIA